MGLACGQPYSCKDAEGTVKDVTIRKRMTTLVVTCCLSRIYSIK